MKILKYLLLTVVIVVLLIIALIITVAVTVDPNDYKPEIVKVTKEATGRELQIEGDIRLSFFPWLAIKMGKVELSNAKGFKGDHFAQLEGVDAGIEILPLLKGKVQVGMVHLKGLNINLQRNKSGNSNWDDLMAQETEDKTAQAETSSNEEQFDTQDISIEIGGIKIEDANISWQDTQAGLAAKIKQFNLNTGKIELNKPIQYTTHFKIHNTSPKLLASMSSSGVIDMDIAQQKLKLNKFKLKVESQEFELLKGTQRLDLSSDIIAAISTEQYRLDNAKVLIKLVGPDIPNGEQVVTVNTGISIDMKQQRAELTQLTVKAMGLEIESKLTAKNIMQTPSLLGELKIKPFSLKKLIVAAGAELPAMASEKALQHMEVAMSFSGDTKQATLNKLHMKLDDTTITGDAKVTDLMGKPAFRMGLQFDKIDADLYMPPAIDNSAEQQNQSTMTGDELIELPIQAMRDLQAIGKIKIGHMKAMNLKLNNVIASMEAKAGLILFPNLEVDLYDGRFVGDAKIDVQKEKPVYAINIGLNNVHAKNLLTDFVGQEFAQGVLNFKSKLETQGSSVNQLTRGLNGTADFSFKEGKLKGINLNELLREGKFRISELKKALKDINNLADLAKADAHMKSITYTPKDTSKDTDFGSMSGEIVITKGVVDNRVFTLRSPHLAADGKGTADLNTERLNYRLDANYFSSVQDSKADWIPLKIKGTFSSPSPSIDTKALIDKAKQEWKQEQRELAKKKVEEKVQEEKDKAKQKLEDKLKDKLKEKFKLKF